MAGPVMVAVLWAAALYRVVLSIKSQKTPWRTAFTCCAVAVALGATTSVFGDQTIDRWTGVSNLALLLTRLALTGAAVAALILNTTLLHEVVPTRAVRLWLLGGALLVLVQVVAWGVAPIHDDELPTTAEVDRSSAAGCIFAVAFGLAITLGTAAVASFCLRKAAANRRDITRTVSLLLSGVACVAGAVLFALATVAVLLKQLANADTPGIPELVNRAVPFVAVVLACGTLSLLLAPPVVDVVQSYRRWKLLQPLWRHLVQLQPEVHLEVPPSGGPLTRLHVRLQRTIVEVYDALRITPVSVPPAADVDQLADALHRIGGPQMAGEVLARVRIREIDDGDRLLVLARRYARSCS